MATLFKFHGSLIDVHTLSLLNLYMYLCIIILTGELDRGDQIMMVEGKTFIDINRQIAEKFLDKCMEDTSEVRVNTTTHIYTVGFIRPETHVL